MKMNKIDYTALIEKYLDGELSDSEVLNFESKLMTESRLSDELILHKEIREAISDQEVLKLRELLKDYSSKKKNKTKLIKYYIFPLFAACSILVFALIFSNNSSIFSSNNDDIYKKFFKHVESGSQTRGVSEQKDNDYQKAFNAYDNYDFKTAIELFQKNNYDSENNCYKEFFTGLSYMELENFKKALSHLELATQCGQNLYSDDVLWYIGLCYLKVNDKEKAISYFKVLKTSTSYNQKRANEILEELN
jgi:hypothetical protein